MCKEIRFPHSLGLLYSAFTAYCGFKVNSGEYKLMGLAPYGRPAYAQRILDHLIDVKADGSFRLNMRYFDFHRGLSMTNARFERLFGGPPREPETPFTQRDADLAASIQAVLEDVLCRMAQTIARETHQAYLCMAGGVALNCVANAKIRQKGFFRDIWIQPAAGDSGGAVGAALAAYYLYAGAHRNADGTNDAMNGALLGPAYTHGEIETVLRDAGAIFSTLDERALLDATVHALAEGKAVGWFQGRMEFGPRALGCRSILADPRPETMRAIINEKVKLREAFRPFAPSIPVDCARAWFQLDGESPYMLLTAAVDAPLPIPAVTHIDGSARVQTVRRETNRRYYDLLRAFEERTGCAVLLNTSFNVRGEPIVCTPTDALRCFMGTDIDVLVMGDCFLDKSQQHSESFKRYAATLEAD
jgi:carbamoyltransferase